MEVLNRDCLGLIFDFFGKHEWLIGQFVCRRWRILLRQRSSVWVGRCDLSEFQASLQLFRWAYSNKCPVGDLTVCMYEACEHGRLNIMQFADSTLIPTWNRSSHTGDFWRWNDLQRAVQHNQISIAQWLHSIQKVPYDQCRYMVIAARYNLDEMLKFLHVDGCPWHKDVCYGLVRNHNLPMLQWVRAHGCPWNRKECLLSADQDIHEWILTQPE